MPSWVHLPLHVFSILDLWANNSWILHHDNASSHSAIIIRKFLTKNETNTIQQPSNSPDMAFCDFFLFDRVKKPLWGTRFNSRKEVIEKSKTALMAIPTIEFQNVSRAGSSAGIKTALQSMGSTLKGTISLLMNKTYILWIFWMNSGNFLIKIIIE